MFHACSTWFSDNRLALNVKKTNFMIIGNVPKNIYAPLPFNNGIVNRVYSVKYLGIMLDYKLCWDQHINYIFGKCSKGLGMIKRVRYFLPTSCLLSLYYAFVYPCAQNGNELYGTEGVTYLHPLKIILKSCVRSILFAHHTAHCMPFAKQLKILLFDDLLFLRTAILMHKIYNSAICSAVHGIFVHCSTIHSHYTRSSDLNFYLNHATNKISKCFIAFHGALVWNSLSVSSKELSSLPKFKSKIINNMFNRYV